MKNQEEIILGSIVITPLVKALETFKALIAQDLQLLQTHLQ
jgi:hypothetical protein